MPGATNPYDEVLYAGHPFIQTHPDRLATIARLFGMSPAPVEQCHVLEIGCGDGGNLIPMAYTLPGSEFVGLDLGSRGIELGRQMADTLDLKNVALQCMDIRDAGATLGKFDYIVAHGVYSWVPREVQDSILRICRDNLNAHGVAYVSYNVYPGAHVRQMVAEMMQYHARRFAEPAQQIEQALALAAFLAARPPVDGYSLLLKESLDMLAQRRPGSLFHDELSEHHTAMYFREFAERASLAELQYLGEADFTDMQDTAETPEVRSTLRKLGRDAIEKEQYLDFLKCRRFRQTLLCHAGERLNRRLDSAQVREFYIAAARHEEPPRLPADHPMARAAMAALREAWPGAMGFGPLMAAVRERAGEFDEDEALVSDVVLACFACGIVQLHVRRPEFARTVSERPRASSVARFQAARGTYVTSLCHRAVNIEDDVARRLLIAADGSRDAAALSAELGPEVDVARGLDELARLGFLEG